MSMPLSQALSYKHQILQCVVISFNYTLKFVLRRPSDHVISLSTYQEHVMSAKRVRVPNAHVLDHNFETSSKVPTAQ